MIPIKLPPEKGMQSDSIRHIDINILPRIDGEIDYEKNNLT